MKVLENHIVSFKDSVDGYAEIVICEGQKAFARYVAADLAGWSTVFHEIHWNDALMAIENENLKLTTKKGII